jgi:hemerythrin-like domain-containing protein
MTTTLRTRVAPPDLTTFAVLHRAMRVDGTRLAAAVAAVGDADRTRVAALARWYRGFCAELHEHHTVEDELFFPVLADRVPSFDGHAERIELEHHQLDDALAGVGAALDALAEPGGRVASHTRAVAATRELADLLERHLGFEDADVLPLYVRHFTADEYAEIEQRARKRASLANLTFTIPWGAQAASDDERARMFGAAPLAFRLVWYASRRRYARLAERALGAP